MDKAAENAAALAALDKRIHAARTTREKLCQAAGVGYATFWRGTKTPGSLSMASLGKLETAMAAIEAERATA